MLVVGSDIGCIGMHGAAVAMAMQMSVGAPRCCAVLEVFNSRTKFGSYRFHGNALRSVGVFYSHIQSVEYTSMEREEAWKGLQVHSCPSENAWRSKRVSRSHRDLDMRGDSTGDSSSNNYEAELLRWQDSNHEVSYL